MAPAAWAVGAKAEVWLARHASLRLAGADASAAGARGQRAGDRRAFDLEVGKPECRQFSEQVIDTRDRGFGALEVDSNHHRKPRELCDVLRGRVVHCTFLGENGGQYQ